VSGNSSRYVQTFPNAEICVRLHSSYGYKTKPLPTHHRQEPLMPFMRYKICGAVLQSPSF
jgi:hypothetical protein